MVNYMEIYIQRGAWMADAVSTLPFTTESQVKPGQTGLSWMGDLGIAHRISRYGMRAC